MPDSTTEREFLEGLRPEDEREFYERADSPTLYVADCPHEPPCMLTMMCSYRPASRSEILSAARSHLDYEAAATWIARIHDGHADSVPCIVCEEAARAAVDAALNEEEE